MNKYFIFLIVLGVFSAFSQSKRSFVVPSQYAQGVGMIGSILQDDVLVRSAPDLSAQALGKLRVGDRVSVGEPISGFRRVKLLLQNQQILDGYVENQMLRLDSAPISNGTLATQTTTAPKPADQQQSIQSSAASAGNQMTQDHLNHVLLAYAPTFDLRKFGTFQQGIGLGFGRNISPRMSWNLPLQYSTGGGFSMISGGVGIGFHMNLSPTWLLMIQPQLLSDFLFGNQKKVMASSVALSWSLRYKWSDSYGIGLEPYSVIAMLWNNQEIPWNLRARSTAFLYYSF